MKKSLQIKETGNKKTNGGNTGANLPAAGTGKASGGKSNTNAGNSTIINPATNKAGAAGGKVAVATNLATASNILTGGKTSIAGNLAAMKATAASKGQGQNKTIATNKAKSSEPEIICIDID